MSIWHVIIEVSSMRLQQVSNYLIVVIILHIFYWPIIEVKPVPCYEVIGIFFKTFYIFVLKFCVINP